MMYAALWCSMASTCPSFMPFRRSRSLNGLTPRLVKSDEGKRPNAVDESIRTSTSTMRPQSSINVTVFCRVDILKLSHGLIHRGRCPTCGLHDRLVRFVGLQQ